MKRILLLLTLAFFVAAPRAGLNIDDPFPDLRDFHLEGTVPDYKGKVVLVDFWASWCGPCKGSFPVLDALHEKYGRKNVVIIGINLDKKKADMEDFLHKHPVHFAILRDPEYKLVSTIHISTMPSSFLLSPDGKVRAIHKGFRGEETDKEYQREIDALLK